MLSKTFVLIAGLVGLVAASPYKPECDSQTLCIDGINDCGVGWGGCYDTCSPQLSPTPPPCTSTEAPHPETTEY
ncbi:hypothetical protein FALBO_14960 [Fusarium albosuccineum]|uniref:Uncharacterized protein n=1 Tax=Fusarium albosuccineum TaxID=1237068 RepID=A0A8H4KX23_9HYPO|nr:hypothetical protein FALBO_14960 [Fusarium albosuccineum]